jgi:hypothetical protein
MPYTDLQHCHRLRASTMMLSAGLLCVLLGACGGSDGLAADDDREAALPAASTPPVPPSAPPGVPPAPPPTALAPGHQLLAMPLETLKLLSPPFGTPHQAIPAGVPGGFDWRERSRRGSGNNVPTGFNAFTGWAQAFWIEGAPVGAQKLEIRQYQTLLCTAVSGTRLWQRVQLGDIEGAAFRADYADNLNVPPEAERLAPSHWRIGFGAGRAYHFWPRQGRTTLGADRLCGVVVLFEARAVELGGRALPAGTAATLVVGGGADYWLDTAVRWDQYRTNADVGIGVLRRVGPDWEWHGMGTADSEALTQLAREGFVDRSAQ